MANQNLRAYLLRFEDFGAGPGNTQEIILGGTQTPVAVGLPYQSTQSFNLPATPLVGMTNLPWFPGPSVLGYGEHFLFNRNHIYWLTVICSVYTNNSTSTSNVMIPIPPLAQVFLPYSIFSIQSIQGGNAYSSVQPLQTTGNQNQTIDLVGMQ